MIGMKVSRRDFARAVGATLGASLVAPDLARAGSPAPAPPAAPPAKEIPGAPPAAAVRLDSNENPYGPSPQALEAMRRSQSVAARYPDALETRVIETIASQHGVSPEQVILGCGSGEVLRIADLAFLGPGRTVVAAEPTFEAVLHHARVLRAEPTKVPLTADHRHDLPRMAAACDERTGLVYLCNPNNPTGTIVTGDELQAFFERAPKTATLLVDEAYHHFVEDARYKSAGEWIGKVPNLLLVRTFSKIYGLAGMRLGYGIGSRETIAAMQPHQIWSNANASVLEAALASLEDKGLLPRYRQAMNGTRRWLCAELEKDGRSFIPSEANFVMIDVGGDVAPVIASLKARGVLVGRKFPSLPSWLRVSIGTPEEMQRFLAGLRVVVPRKEIRAA